MRTRTWTLLTLLVTCWSVVAAEGLTVPDAARAWPQWQARLSLNTGAVQRFSLADAVDASQPRSMLQGGALLGDYYFRSLRFGWLAPQGGFRATSGLMVGTRTIAVGDTLAGARSAWPLRLAVQSHPWAASAPVASDTVPYLGIGYTGLSVKGGWGFTADLGLTAESGATRFGRAVLGDQGFDTTLRELRLSPVLQLGVSYSF